VRGSESNGIGCLAMLAILIFFWLMCSGTDPCAGREYAYDGTGPYSDVYCGATLP